ncbi:Golgin subfamily A member 5 [Paragonimus heterotremus]|uniref:Golgin subfamily A member 5 n=1 Tax=Paragonimus heterotremus TaxID=100268 RepID=A0A8J4T8H7_9TREM|nr:Golgin subfamily A member 5 [Paragonimus heterotremus]
MSWLSDLASKAENLLNTIDSSTADALNSTLVRKSPTGWRLNADRTDHSNVEPHAEQLWHASDAIESGSSPLFVNLQHTSVPLLDTSKETAAFHPVANSSVQPRLTNTIDSLIQPVHLDPFASSNETRVEEYRTHLTSGLINTELGAVTNDNSISSGYHTLATEIHSVANDDHVPSTVAADLTELNRQGRSRVQQMTSDTRLENKLLRSEVSSLSQEVSDLLRRNHKATEENKELRGQIERLENQLRDSDFRVRELQLTVKQLEMSASSMKPEFTIDQPSPSELELNVVREQLQSKEAALATLNVELHECRRLNELAEKRVQIAQQQTVRITQELGQYKEKASHILTMKDKLIASLRSGGKPDAEQPAGSQMTEDVGIDLNRQLSTVQAECDILREEVARWRIEVDHRELSNQELELQMQTERDALRHNLDLAEQRAEREKQLREDADTELIHLRCRQRELEETLSKQKAEFHRQLVANESELGRLRQLLSRRQTTDNGSSDGGVTRTDPEHVLTLESRLRQLTDTLLARQDALDSVLAQNHALKIRLERAQSDNESLASALGAEDNQLNAQTRVRLPFQTAGGYGCARLVLHNSVVPRPFRAPITCLDELAMRLTNICRRWPLTRLICFIYLGLLHFWLLFASVLFLPNPARN